MTDNQSLIKAPFLYLQRCWIVLTNGHPGGPIVSCHDFAYQAQSWHLPCCPLVRYWLQVSASLPKAWQLNHSVSSRLSPAVVVKARLDATLKLVTG